MCNKWNNIVDAVSRGDLDCMHGQWCDAAVEYLMITASMKCNDERAYGGG